MRIALLHRPGATSGGDWVAMVNMAGALYGMGIDIDLCPANAVPDLSAYDFAWLWAACSPDWGLPAAREARRQGARLIITPFWWSRAERQAFYGFPGQDIAPGYTESVAETLTLADVLFTVTESEAAQCLMLDPTAKCHIVPMGTMLPDEVVAGEPQDYVLCIGRIEPHKNQHSLARACERLGYRLILAGSIAHPIYSGMIPGAYYRHGISDAEKWELLSHACVHALPSFFENPGLVHGEALAMGIPAVMGNRGCEPEFYKHYGLYCDPTSIDSIANAVEMAWNCGRRKLAKLPTWIDAANAAREWLRAHA